MKKKKLFTPGPTEVPEEVLLEMAKPIIHHRTDEFKKIAEEVIEDLKYLFRTKNDVLILCSSGTGAMEAAVSNLFSPGEKIAVICGGKFGERFAEIGNSFGLDVLKLEVEWGSDFKSEKIEEVLNENPDIKGVFATLCETSTATQFDIKGFGEVVSKYEDTVLVVDAISSLGAVPCLTDEWKIDVVITGSQKALMLPPGLSFISLSEKAWKKVEKSTLPKYYFDLKKYKKNIQKADFPYTMAVSLIVGLRKSLRLIREYTIEKIWEEHHKRAEATRRAFQEIGLQLLSSSPSDAVTAVVLPEGIDGQKLIKLLREKYGISIAGGQEKLKGKIIRISHLGWQDEFDVLLAISSVGIGLQEMGYEVEIEKGLKVAREILFK
ncbi:MAG TPA: alanine--glyoxylate aminotransferase family protein [Firmicutes bacterium]|nr:alanine--glyoxylate aminotransferase family protein [Bacillota bacterium]